MTPGRLPTDSFSPAPFLWQYGVAGASQVGRELAGCKHCEALKLGDVTTLNLTMLDAGVSLDNRQTCARADALTGYP